MPFVWNIEDPSSDIPPRRADNKSHNRIFYFYFLNNRVVAASIRFVETPHPRKPSIFLDYFDVEHFVLYRLPCLTPLSDDARMNAGNDRGQTDVCIQTLSE